MNICFFSGNIITKPEFKFIIGENICFKECDHISICYFEIKGEGETKIKIKAYDGLADYCFKNFERGDYIFASR